LVNKYLEVGAPIVYYIISEKTRNTEIYRGFRRGAPYGKRYSGMKMKRIMALLLASVMLCGTAASCGKKTKTGNSKDDASQAGDTKSSSKSSDSKKDKDGRELPPVPELPTAVPIEEVDFEEAEAAESGDAYLAIADKDWKVQYWGDTGDNNQLSFEAGVAHITGNGDYTVSVTADTNGFRYESTGDPDGKYLPQGLGFAAVIISDGEKALPSAVITVNSVKVDGREIDLKGKSYTNTESGEIRSNIYNEWVSDDALPADARTAEGALFNGFNVDAPTELNDGSCSARIVDEKDFKEWTTVEVGFTVSGLSA